MEGGCIYFRAVACLSGISLSSETQMDSQRFRPPPSEACVPARSPGGRIAGSSAVRELSLKARLCCSSSGLRIVRAFRVPLGFSQPRTPCSEAHGSGSACTAQGVGEGGGAAPHRIISPSVLALGGLGVLCPLCGGSRGPPRSTYPLGGSLGRAVTALGSHCEADACWN